MEVVGERIPNLGALVNPRLISERGWFRESTCRIVNQLDFVIGKSQVL